MKRETFFGFQLENAKKWIKLNNRVKEVDRHQLGGFNKCLFVFVFIPCCWIRKTLCIMTCHCLKMFFLLEGN